MADIRPDQMPASAHGYVLALRLVAHYERVSAAAETQAGHDDALRLAHEWRERAAAIRMEMALKDAVAHVERKEREP